jgi:hypothetical protein
MLVETCRNKLQMASVASTVILEIKVGVDGVENIMLRYIVMCLNILV